MSICRMLNPCLKKAWLPPKSIGKAISLLFLRNQSKAATLMESHSTTKRHKIAEEVGEILLSPFYANGTRVDTPERRAPRGIS